MTQGFNKNPLKNPDGSVAIIENVSGIAFKSDVPLLANGVFVSPWISYDQYPSASTIIFADVISAVGGVKYEYSTDGGITIIDTINVSFTTLNDFRVAIFPVGKGSHLRITYTNGAIAQTKFYFSLSMGLDVVSSMGSVFSPINTSNIAAITKSFLQLPDSNTVSGLYDFITRSGNSLNVNLTNALPIGNNTVGKFKLTDNINTATIKGANDPAIPIDTALVVTMSPNSVAQNNASDGSVTAGISGTKSSLSGAVFNTVLPTLTNGQQVSNQSDSNGNLKVVVQPSINLIGKVGIDQTTQGTTNFVTNNHTQIAGNVIATNSGINGLGVQRVTIATDNSALASNQTQKLGVTLTTGNGLITSNTERIVLANRAETITGSIATSSDFVPTAGQRIKSLLFTNNTIATIFLQLHNKTTALVLGDVPFSGLIYRVPANSTLDKTVADFGETGILYGNNIRVGLSSTFDTYTSISALGTSINIITVI